MPCKHRKHTPVKSQAQKKAMGVAYASKKGKKIKGGLRGPAKEMKKGMTKVELRSHIKEVSGKDLPKKVKKKK